MKNKLNLFRQYAGGLVKFLFTITFLLTLCVGQMWGDTGFYNCYFTYNDGSNHSQNQDASGMANKDLGTLSSNLTIKAAYLKVWDNNGSGSRKLNNGQFVYTKDNWSHKSYAGEGGWTQSSKDGNNYELQKSSVTWTLASTTDASGSYTLKYYWQAWGDGDKYLNNGGSNYQFTYKIAPPAVSDFTITPSGAGYVSGTGTEDDPYIMKHDAGNLVLTISGSKAHTDANSSAKYYNGSSWSATATKTIAYASGSTTKQSITLKMKYNNSTASLDGAVSERTVWYQRETAYNVRATANPSAGGNPTPSSLTATGQYSGISITAPANTGYTFSTWSIVSGGAGTFGSAATTASNTFYPTKATDLKATFTAKNYTVKLSKNGGDTDGTVTTTYNSTSTKSFTGATYAGHSCDGYFTAKSGGSKILNADGTLPSSSVASYLSSGNWVGDTVTILYAQWTEDVTNYTVNYGVYSSHTSYGSLCCATTIGGTAVSSGGEVASGTNITFTASPISGYEVDAWYRNSSCTSVITEAGYANTFAPTITKDTTVYVKFKKKIYTVTYSPSSAPTGCTYTTKPTTGTYGNTVTMVITPSTGYTVSVSARDASSNVVTISNPSANTYTFTQPASAVTVTVSTSQIMSALSTSCHYDVGNPSYAAPTVSGSATNVGYATTRTITATAAGTGYTFAGWTLTNCTRTDGGAPTATSITIRSNGDGAAATVVANYTEVLTTVWYLTGSFNSWSASANKFAKRTGESTGSVAYTTIDLPASTHYEFGVNNGSSYYSNNNGSSETYYIKESVENWTFEKDLGYGVNCHMKTTVAGTYTFKIDFSASNPKISVTYPVSYTLTYGIGTVKGNDGSISTSPSTASGSKVISGTNITLTAPEAKTGYTWKGWYTNAGGTEGKITDTNRAITVTMNANKTLYACYTENTYPVSVSAGSNGDVSPKGTVNVKQVSGTNLTATPNTGYHFVDWTISGGGITPGSSSNATQTFKATETGGSIQANFAEDMHTVTVATNNAAFGSVNHSSASAGIATASSTLTATPETGATFTGWTIPSGVTVVSPATSSSTSITIRATADSKTITANFSETKYSVTLTNADGTYGTVNTSSPVSVGQITAVQIQATPKSGYMLSGWVKTSGDGTVTYHTAAGTGKAVDPTGNTQATTYITVDDDVTLQATWEEDRSSGWYMRGNWTDGWTTSGQKAFVKDVGEGSGTVSHVRWTLDPRNFTNATMQMKMYDGADTYGHWNGDEDASNKCTKDGNNSNLGFYKDTGGDPHSNFRISISVYGEYDFEWDSSTKQLTVHYPTGNFIRGDFNSWGWEDLLTATGTANEYAGSIHLAANQTWSAPDHGFKAVILGDHYGKNSTNLTRASNSASDLSRSGANIGLTTDVEGDYTFTINTSSKNLSVTYPTAYTVTFGYGVGGSAVTASAESRGDGTFASGGYVAAGDDITFTQTPAAGYTFKGWYTTADGNTTVSTMGVSDNVLNGLSGNATVYAQYTPTTYTNVTLNATTGSTNGAYSVTFGGTTITVTTDPLKTGYEPEGFYESYADGNWTNKIAASDGTLQSGTTYTDATGHWKATNSPTLYTKWQPKTYTVTLDKNGSSAGYLKNGSVTATYDSNTLTSLTVPARTGYHLVDGYYKEPGLTNKIINLNGTLCTSTAYTDVSGRWTNDGAVSLYAKWAANTYTVTFDPADGSVDPTSASVTFDAAVSNAPVPTRTGYTFTGYNTAGGASITTNAGEFKSSVDGFTDGSAHWVQPDDATITAQWTPNPYTITLTQSTETGYGSAGTASVEATYDAALPTIASLPTAANGYAFMGYFTDHNGVGTQYYDADGTKLVASYTTADNLELFAYFKKAEITAITFSPAAVVAPNATITATPTISPTPTGTTSICWRVLYSNDNPLDPQPTMTPGEGNSNSISFSAKETSGTYKVEAVLHLGGECKGTTLDSVVANFLVAGDHEVTVQYKDASGNTLQASGTVTGKPLEWSAEAITAPDIFGYTFARWEAGDGVTLSKDGSTDHAFDTAQVASIYIKAVYDGRLTAVYNQNQMIYFKNTLGWENVYVNFHTGDAWINTDNGSGSPKGVGNSGLSEKNRNNHMIQIGESDIYYYDYGAAGISPSLYISFTDQTRPSASEFWGANPGINVVYPANYADAISTDKSSENGFKAATPMFVPLAPQDPVAKNVTSTGKANYYNSGYWTTYTAGTGYTLEIYYDNDGSACIYSIPFTSADDLMPMTAKVDLEASTTYRYQVRRGGTESAGIYYGNTGTMKYDNRGDGTGWIMENTMEGGFKKAKITTNASGDYTFNLSYSANNKSEYRLRMEVDYPIANNDYRLVYSDATQTKPIISAIVTKANNSKDTVSFFIRPASAALVIQQATVTKEGAITWNAYSTITSFVSGLAKDSVYNICLTMDGTGAISVENVEAYTGNFYIRTNAAGSSKWDNFCSSDHLMTYSEYSATNADYSHYFMAYVGNGTNVKFVVANDYAPNISDTVIVQTYRGGDASHVDEDGNIKADANVRFMWNRHNNGAYRAYLAAAKSDGSNFLVLRADDDEDLMDENGNALLNSANSGEAGYNHKAPDNSIQFVDDDNWIYKATVKVKPSAYVKLYAYFNTKYFYYKGVDNNTFDGSNAIQLMTGTGEAEKIHVIYDFKTDRLVAAWIPSGNISEEREINADVMFVREHQGDIEQLTFTGSGAITEIKTAYAVLRFNKWTLNNKSKAAGHAVLNPGASRYERDLFYVSFPFRVSMEEVFGFGKYGQHWIVEEYDGEARAANGFWADTPSYWRFITNRKGRFFEPNKGYIIALDLDEMGESSDVWNNGVENVELYFPSYGTMGNITNATVVHTLPAHAYDPAAHPTHTDDRSIKDSHWNVMSVPTYVNTSDVTFAPTTWTASKPSFLYEWNMDDNSLTARSGSGYTYHAMHAYIVQYAGNVTWTSTSVTPASIVARRTYAEAPNEVEFCLELQQNEKTADHTFVRLSNDEEVSAGFAFGEDMSKEFNKTRSNIYTFIGTEQVAGNTLPMTEQTTVVPVGVIAKTTGDYTFTIPEGTNGVGVTLIDIETGIRTPLSALDYTVNLGAGTYDERFVLEISPVQQTPTGVEEVTGDGLQVTGARKVMIDGILYIVKDGKMFDATGALVK